MTDDSTLTLFSGILDDEVTEILLHMIFHILFYLSWEKNCCTCLTKFEVKNNIKNFHHLPTKLLKPQNPPHKSIPISVVSRWLSENLNIPLFDLRAAKEKVSVTFFRDLQLVKLVLAQCLNINVIAITIYHILMGHTKWFENLITFIAGVIADRMRCVSERNDGGRLM